MQKHHEEINQTVIQTKQEQTTVTNLNRQMAPPQQQVQKQPIVGEQVQTEVPMVFTKWKHQAVLEEAGAMDEGERIFMKQTSKWQKKQFETLSGKDRRYSSKQREKQYNESLGYFTSANMIKKKFNGLKRSVEEDSEKWMLLQESYFREISKARLKYIKATSEDEDGENFLTQSEQIRCLQEVLDSYRKDADDAGAEWHAKKVAELEKELSDLTEKFRADTEKLQKKEQGTWEAETALYESKIALMKQQDSPSFSTNVQKLFDQLFGNDREKHSAGFEVFRDSVQALQKFLSDKVQQDKTGRIDPESQDELLMLLEQAQKAGGEYLSPKNRSHKKEEYRKRYDLADELIQLLDGSVRAVTQADPDRDYMLDEIVDMTVVKAPVLKTWKQPGADGGENGKKN